LSVGDRSDRPSSQALVRIDESRLIARLRTLARCGLGPTGRYRGLYDDGWADATALVSTWMADAGLSVRRDAVGNVWGRLAGRTGSPVIVTGSHIDTVRGGGPLDGALGVVAGIEALAALSGSPLNRSLETVAFCEEEGSRFSTQFFGSRAVVGEVSAEETAWAVDDHGRSLARAMVARGLDPARVTDAARDDIDAFVELHIEQGAILEELGPSLGVVTAIAGTALLQIEVRGEADHAGTTPMSRRHDALRASAAMIEGVASVAREHGDPAVATVGQILVEPSQSNVVPGFVRFTIDARHSVEAERLRLVTALTAMCHRVAGEQRVKSVVKTIRDEAVVPVDARISEVVRQACRVAGIEPRLMPSAALQDSQIMARKAAVGMIFVPSIGGRSHRGDEETSPEHIVLGTRVLATTLRSLAA
jgi:allantoate deiminase